MRSKWSQNQCVTEKNKTVMSSGKVAVPELSTTFTASWSHLFFCCSYSSISLSPSASQKWAHSWGSSDPYYPGNHLWWIVSVHVCVWCVHVFIEAIAYVCGVTRMCLIELNDRNPRKEPSPQKLSLIVYCGTTFLKSVTDWLCGVWLWRAYLTGANLHASMCISYTGIRICVFVCAAPRSRVC